jgi:pimeloyl-ACP methyl ester carboxylesterase
MAGMRLQFIAVFTLGALLSPDRLAAQPPAAPALKLDPCRISDMRGLVSVAARCGKFPVPEDPEDPDGKRIELAVAVVPAIATRAKPDPLFLLAGGPGQGAIEGFVAHLGAFDGIHRERDLVMVDQRGTGGSNRLDCDIPDDALESDEISPAEIRKLGKECLAKLPGRPEFYATSIAVRDLDAVRAALGYESINLFGGSYGTRVAQHYARRYPERTRTITIDSIVPPALPLMPLIAIEAQRALERVFARCAADRECSEHFPALAEQFAHVDTRLQQGPVAVALPDPVTGEINNIDVTRNHLVMMTRMLSYSARTASLLPLVIHEAATRGNYGPLAAQALMVGEDLERMIAMGMHNSVVCSEDAPRFAGAVERAALEKTYIGPVMVDGMSALCEVWPRGAVDSDFHEPLHSKVPALLLSGEFDPATPPNYGATAAAGFDQHLHLVIPGQGHGQTDLPCVQRLLRQFIESGAVAGLDASCVGDIKPAPFFLTFSGTGP